MPKNSSTTSRSLSQNLPEPPSLGQTIGPSFILLGLALGSGELILWPYLAANWGLGLLWGGLLGITFQYVLNTEVMRYSLAWGESVFVGFRRLGWWIPIWFILSTFIPWSLPGFSSASTDILLYMFPWLPKTPIALGLLIMTGLILSAGKTLYRTIELFQKTIILVGLPFILLLAAWLTTSQDWIEYGYGLVGRGDGWWFFPPGVALASFLGAFAYSGAGGNLNLAQSYYIKEKGFGMGKYAGKISALFSGHIDEKVKVEGQIFADTASNWRKWQAWWRLVNQEHFIVFWMLGFIMISVLAVLAKATAYGLPSESGLNFLYLEATVISERASIYFANLFLIVAAVMLFSTQVGVLESSSRIISENILLMFHKPGKKSSFNITLWFYIALWSQIGLGALIYLAGFQEPRVLLTLGAVLNAAAMMMAFVFIFWLNKTRLDKKFQAGLLRKGIMAVAFTFFLILVLITLKDFQI